MRYAYALIFGSLGWLAHTLLWWAAYGQSPRQTLILWEFYSPLEWVIEGAALHLTLAGFFYLMLTHRG